MRAKTMLIIENDARERALVLRRRRAQSSRSSLSPPLLIVANARLACNEHELRLLARAVFKLQTRVALHHRRQVANFVWLLICASLQGENGGFEFVCGPAVVTVRHRRPQSGGGDDSGGGTCGTTFIARVRVKNARRRSTLASAHERARAFHKPSACL